MSNSNISEFFPVMWPPKFPSDSTVELYDTTSVPTGEDTDLCPLGVSAATWRQQALLILGYLVMIVVTIVGNMLIILAIKKEPKLQTVGNMFYVSLASADMLVGWLVMPPMIIYSLHDCWPLGALACDIWLSVDSILTSASFLGLSVVAADRYYAIADPFKHMRTQTKNRVMIQTLVVWAVSFLAWVPPIFISRAMSGVYVDYYCDDGAMTGVYALLSNVLLYHVPLVVMVTYYIRLYLVIRKQLNASIEKSLNTSSASLETQVSGVSCSNVNDDKGRVKGQSIKKDQRQGADYGGDLEHQRKMADQRMRAEKERRAARMLGSLIVVFVLCWSGWVTIAPIDAMKPGSIPGWVYEFSVWTAYLNSTINPFLYVFSNRDFRLAIKKLFTS